MTSEQPRRTSIGGSTLDLDRELDLGDRLLFLVDATVQHVGMDRTSNGDIEVRRLKVLDLLEVPEKLPTGVTFDEVLDTARAERRARQDEKLGRMALPLDEDRFLVSFACGHDAHYPEDWMEREESSSDELSTYWRDQARPVEGGSAPCPVCYRTAGDGIEPGNVEEVTAVALEPSGTVDVDGDLERTGQTLARPEDLLEILGVSDYDDLDADEIIRRLDDQTVTPAALYTLATWHAEHYDGGPLDELVDYYADRLAVAAETPPWASYETDTPAQVRADLDVSNARHVILFEEAHKARKTVLAAAEELLAAAAPTDDEETF